MGERGTARIVVDGDGVIVESDDAFAELAQLDTTRQAVGSKLSDVGFSQSLWRHLLPALGVLGSLPPVRSFIRGANGQVKSISVAAQRHDNGEDVELVLSLLTDASDESRAPTAVMVEAVEWNRAFQEAAKLAGIGLAINTFNKDGTVRNAFVNEVAKQMRASLEPNGFNPIPPEPILDTLQRRGSVTYQTHGSHWLRATAINSQFRGRQAIYVMLEDVTTAQAQKQKMLATAQELRRARVEVEHLLDSTRANPLKLPKQFAQLIECSRKAEEQLRGEIRAGPTTEGSHAARGALRGGRQAPQVPGNRGAPTNPASTARAGKP